jgi:hypothetical protein
MYVLRVLGLRRRYKYVVLESPRAEYEINRYLAIRGRNMNN